MTEASPKWQSEVINGIYPLRRYLSGSDHSAVCLTECKAQDLPTAAIKIVPAERALPEAQLSHWITAAGLSHPHMIRLFDAGRCQLGGRPFLFVVMEDAEQTLAQVLPHRALTADEAPSGVRRHRTVMLESRPRQPADGHRPASPSQRYATSAGGFGS